MPPSRPLYIEFRTWVGVCVSVWLGRQKFGSASSSRVYSGWPQEDNRAYFALIPRRSDNERARRRCLPRPEDTHTDTHPQKWLQRSASDLILFGLWMNNLRRLENIFCSRVPTMHVPHVFFYFFCFLLNQLESQSFSWTTKSERKTGGLRNCLFQWTCSVQ